MKILLNMASAAKGGAIQRSVSLIREVSAHDRGHQWSFALSASVAAELTHESVPTVPNSSQVFDPGPARSLATRRALRAFSLQQDPDVVFTSAGPAYVRFPVPHLCSCTDGWVTHSTWAAYQTLDSVLQRVNFKLTALYKYYWFHQCDACVTQTETAAEGLSRRIGISPSRIHVVPNTCSSIFLAPRAHREHRSDEPLRRILCLAAPYAHKRLELIPDVANQLKMLGVNRFQFVLTIPHDHPTWSFVVERAMRLGVSDAVANEGPVDVVDVPRLYEQAFVSFVPTVLETFSATYPESMAMDVPIVTTDLGFARDVCRDAALYFHPNSAVDAARQLARVMNEPALVAQLTDRGRDVLAALPTPDQQVDRYLEILEALLNGPIRSDRTV